MPGRQLDLAFRPEMPVLLTRPLTELGSNVRLDHSIGWRTSACFPAFENAGYFCVNTLMPSQEDIANALGGLIPTEDRFSFGQWDEGLTGSPVLHGASVSFECELVNAVDQATHRVMFGRVIGIRENNEPSALLYCMRRCLKGQP